MIHGNHQLDGQSVPHGRSDGAFVYQGFEGWAVGSVYDAYLSGNGQVISRKDGFYWRPAYASTVYPYADVQILEPIDPLEGTGLTPGPGSNVGAAPWRDTVALASVATGSGMGNTLVVAVADDVHMTRVMHGNPELSVCSSGVSIVSSPDGNSVYVGYLRCSMSDFGYVVRRFDCASP